MPDARFFATKPSLSLLDAAKIIGISNSGLGNAEILHVAAPDEVELSAAVVYCQTHSTAMLLAQKQVGLCLTTKALGDRIGDSPVLIVDNPKLAFAQLSARLHLSHEDGPSINLAPAVVHKLANVHASTVIADGVEIDEDVRIGPHCYIGYGVKIGAGSVIAPGVSITHSVLGQKVQILAGAQIGQAGFGFVPDEAGLVRIPQLGRVLIGNEVEIGANTTIDRGALGDTTIGDGTKIDNQIQIGHNVQIGRNCILAAQTGIAGSCVIGDGVMMGGKVGLTDHLSIGDGAQLAAGTGLMHNMPPGEIWAGRPGRPIKTWLRETATLKKLAKKKNG